MRVDRSLENIDLTKLAIYSLIFVIFVLVMVFAVAMPSIDKYKQAAQIRSEKEVNLAKINQLYNDHLATYEKLKQQNTKALESLKNSFNQMKFIGVAGKYFDNIYFTKPKTITSNSKYIISEANVSATMKNPQNLYDFIADMNTHDNLIRVDFPVKMESRDGYIQTSFVIKIYQEP
ncbi:MULTISPECIES: hypothetical protein [Campylobacter]|uniref:hypothetical protein n=1 Tax=Campylobacter TaxID=194 RepID=UPI000A32F8C1|nr:MULTISPECIES: hypothetical protein [unclassified Campylobacter]MEE3694531.1 hypothetical protein [Campylobacter sp. CLAX-22107-21]MEE3712633.1 hypothetical protein [Campylobacter sp. CLAX-7218-21]